MSHMPVQPAARSGGYILVTSLIMMVVLMLIASVVITGSMSSMQQAGGQAGLVQARAAAEAGQASAAYTLGQTVVPNINSALSSYTNTFLQQGGNSATTPIIPASGYATVLANLNAMPGLSQSATVGQGSFTSTITFRDFRTDPAAQTASGQQYYVNYTVTSTGLKGTYRRQTVANGSLQISLGRAALSQYLFLADDGGSLQGNVFTTDMNYDGPVQVNKNWAFQGVPSFSMGAKTNAANVKMYSCTGWVTTANQSAPPCTVPNWNGFGLQYAADKVDLPTNAFSQARAALGQNVTTLSSPSNAERCTALGITCAGNSAPPTGVYLPTGGGIYVQGDAEVALSVVGGNQVYAIKQGTQTTTITVTAPNGPTVMLRPNGTQASLASVPNGQLYVEGAVTSLKGPARTGPLPTPLPTDSAVPTQIPPAIASQTRLSISAATDIVVQGDITYADNPKSNPNAQNVLGLISGSGSVRVGGSAPNDLYLHGAVLAGAASQGLKVDNWNAGAGRGSIHTLGSLAESVDPPRGTYHTTAAGAVVFDNGYGDDFHFDQRFLNGAMTAPFFPGTTLFSVATALPVQRDWQEQ